MSITQELIKSINSQLSPANTCRLKTLRVEPPQLTSSFTLPIWLLHLGNSFIFFWANILDTLYHICSWGLLCKGKREAKRQKYLPPYYDIYCMCIKPKVLEAHMLTYVQCPCRWLQTWSENRDCSTLYIRNACKNDTQNQSSLTTCLMHRPTLHVAPKL